MRLSTAVAVTIGLLLTWERMNAQTKPDESVVGRIAVTAKGTVSFDGAVITIDALKQQLGDLKKRNGVVWYYRDAGKDEPPPQAMQVMKLIVDNRLPISMSTKPDYSDVLLPDGTTQPRPGLRQPWRTASDGIVLTLMAAPREFGFSRSATDRPAKRRRRHDVHGPRRREG